MVAWRTAVPAPVIGELEAWAEGSTGAVPSEGVSVTKSRAMSAAPGVVEWTTLGEESKESKGDIPVACDMNRVLVVDDERSILQLFKTILSIDLPDLTVNLAVNGAEAVQTFSAGHHGVIIMDIHMPVMDGQTTFFEIEKVCRQRNWSMPSVVFCTGYAAPDALRSIVSEGSQHCILLKPVTRSLIADSVKSRLAKS